MLTRLALAAALGTLSLGAPAAGQDAGGILGLLAEPPPERPARLSLDTRTLTLGEAVLVAEGLSDDVLVLTRIAALQVRLLEANATRAAGGAAPLLLPRRICTSSPLYAMCGRLQHTFEPGESP